MKIEINFAYTDAARLKASQQPALSGSWPAPNLGVVPLQGDLVSFGGDDAPVFLVLNRMFIWKSPEHLVVQPLLGLDEVIADQSSPSA